ncbi:MAG: hypothetical protein H0W82_07880 [Actinobacteria bacterium]|nr:hypothetical protein [Actinomycetota bacterium]
MRGQTEVRRDPRLEIHGGLPPALPEATVRLHPAPSPDWARAFSTATAAPSDIAIVLAHDTLTFRAAPEDVERVLALVDRGIRAANDALARSSS